MESVPHWTGRHARALQDALRLTKEEFAAHLGVSPRTIAYWHANKEIVPRKEMQQLLDVVHEGLTDKARQRFSLLLSHGRDDPEPSFGGEGTPYALRVAISVVVSGESILLVCRRGEDSKGITWQFPAGVVKPGASSEVIAVREVLAETGVHCTVRRNLGNRIHPVTAVTCDYFICDYLAGQASNLDVVENVDVTWAHRSALTKFIDQKTIFPPILSVLEEEK